MDIIQEKVGKREFLFVKVSEEIGFYTEPENLDRLLNILKGEEITEVLLSKLSKYLMRNIRDTDFISLTKMCLDEIRMEKYMSDIYNYRTHVQN